MATKQVLCLCDKTPMPRTRWSTLSSQKFRWEAQVPPTDHRSCQQHRLPDCLPHTQNPLTLQVRVYWDDGIINQASRTILETWMMAQEGERSGAGGACGGAGDAACSGEQFVCCARRGCGKDGKKRCGGCKQVNTGCIVSHIV